MTTRHRSTVVTRFAVCAGLLLAAVSLAGCPLVSTTDLKVVNNSNVEVHALYVRPVEDRSLPYWLGQDSWGPNLLEGQTNLGYGVVIVVTDIPNGSYDLLAVGTRTPQYGGDIVRYTQWDVEFDGGFYRWELLPTKDSGPIVEGDSLGEQVGVLPPTGEEPDGYLAYPQEQ